MKIVTRREWGAAAPEGRVLVDERDRKYFVVHHTGGPATQALTEIQAWMMGPKRLADIGYNFAIRSTTGEIYECRGWGVLGAHCPGFNVAGLGVVFIGSELSPEAKRAATWLYAEAVDRAGHGLTPRCHQWFEATECPGVTIADWVHHGGLLQAGPLRVLKLTIPRMIGGDVAEVQQLVGVLEDGTYGPRTAQAVREFQSRHGLVVDGVVGPKTRAALGLE